MLENKDAVIQRINEIPTFVERDIAVMDNGAWVKAEKMKAITEEGDNKPISVVTDKYQTIQFRDIYNPLIAPINSLTGNLTYYRGVGILDIFPEDESLKDERGQIGISALNSVDKSSSVIIRFCIYANGRVYTFPSKIGGLKKVHSGEVLQITQDFMGVMGRIRELWKTIITEFQKIAVDKAFAEDVLNELEIKSDYVKKRVFRAIDISSSYNLSSYNLWDLFITIMETAEHRKTKTDYHLRKKQDLIVDKVFKYAIASKLINA